MRTSSQRQLAHSVGTRQLWRVWSVALAALVAFGAAITAHAQAVVDPPSRVARLSDATGQVWLFSADTNEWVTIARNRPLTTGDRIATDNGARAEVTLGTTSLRLDAATELEIVRLDDTRFQLRLHGGSVAARLRNPQALAEFELATDEGRFRVQTVGRFRFDRFDQTSDVTVLTGQAVYEARNTALPVTTGQHAQFWIDQAGVPQYAMVQLARDDFAAWNDERDRAEDRVAQQRRYVSPEMTGAEELDRYGTWEQTPEYGALWVPRQVPVGWAPYSVGHWAWVRPWGWTWVDDAPWGFAPFHYGRWVYRHDVWCWAPGTYVARPVYAPALVGWIGGPSVSVSVTIGGGPPVGWVPLAPREVYVPPYRYTPRYVREVNVTHVTNITNITTIVNNRNGEGDRRDFANRHVPNAVTFVPQEVMVRRQPVAPVAAQFRNNPQVRSFVADASPPPTMKAPEVSAPPAASRAPQARPPRPPFEGRAPGVAGRPAEAPRPPVAADNVQRPEATRPGAAPRAEVAPQRPPAAADNVQRPELVRPGAAPRAEVAPQRPPAAADNVQRPELARPAPPPRAEVAPQRPPVAADNVQRPEATRPTAAPATAARAEVAPPPRTEGGRADSGRGGRPEFSRGNERGASAESVPPPPSRINPPREAAPAVREPGPPIREAAPAAREAPPRANRPGEAAVAPPPQGQRPPAAGAAPQAAPPAAAQRPPAEHKMTRPEPPQGKEERRDEKREGGGERQR